MTGNENIKNPYTYNAEYTDASTGNQYLRARYYNPEEGTFLTQDSYLGSLLEPLSQNMYTYTENNPVNYTDPSGHGIWSKIKSGAKNLWQDTQKTISNVVSGDGGSSGGGNSRNYSRQPSTYEKAKSPGQSSYNWFNSKLKEAGNILNSWTKGMEKTVKHFCMTANHIKKDSADFISVEKTPTFRW